MPLEYDETPTEGMKRIEEAFSPTAGAGRSMEGYSANVGGRRGPVSGNVMVAADPATGQPVMVGGRAQAGPISYQYNQPTFRGAQGTQTVGATVPFDADAYFGVTAQQGPGGRAYGVNVGRGALNAYGQYNPQRRDLNIGGSYSTNFAEGGRAVVGHTKAAGVPVSLEEHKGQTRHRKDSGDSKMAADYGYIDNSKPDHDGMKTDAFVGPHKDSKKVFVVNQQHPHTKKFNEHKVLLGYNDRAHALRDYAHSFSDGLGHKRIHSVVEMGAHELQDWLKKDHTKPLKKADGGEVEAQAPVPESPAKNHSDETLKILLESAKRENPNVDLKRYVQGLVTAIKGRKLFLVRMGNTVFVMRPLSKTSVEGHIATLDEIPALYQNIKSLMITLKSMGYTHATGTTSIGGFIRLANQMGASYQVIPPSQQNPNPSYKFDMDL
jgi:hypothetical protein